MFAARRALFGLAGGFAITDMYVNSVCLSDMYAEPPPRLRPAGGDFIGNLVKRVGDSLSAPPPPPPLTSLREDIEAALRRNRVAGTLCVCTLVSFGGIWPVLGSAAAILFDGEDGTERYTAVKDWLQS
ncbi:uncharacterized protein Tco025E_05846 [Trypanosoma conorhini]|uniref:Uncharacterized protein n=1 Tax=Trypanosoma conorhini TaxID=83891 RepID=A0A422P9N2_9TRYP|nr:uncharacterized protein Tco025E_05846 [Trypanosoma conorhini]RNF14441.1 hypothetical protein Tco025E_05846 [Trypanosoma conorhini]